MQYPSIAKEILQLKRTDLKVRSLLIASGELFNGYNQKMEEAHVANAKKLEEIISKIGYPNIEKVGEEASQAAWLIIQQSPGATGTRPVKEAAL